MRTAYRDDIVVIDTNIVRILAIPGHSIRRDYYRDRLVNKNLRVSFMTVHEVLWGIQNNKLGPRRTAEVLTDLGQYRIEYASNEFISASVHLRVLFRDQQLSWQDLFVASSALALNCPFVTDDRRLAESLADAGIPGIISRHLEHLN